MLAVITGATSGIGLAFAQAFAARGYDLVVTGRRSDVLEAEAGRIRERGVSVETVVGDLTDTGVFDRLLTTVGDRPVSALVNNAGSGFSADFADSSPDRIRAVNRLLATLPADTMRILMDNLLAAGEPVVINVGSLAGRLAVPGSSVYVASKIYMERLSETIALELAARGVVVQALVPGYVKTDFHRDIPDYRTKQRSRGFIRWSDAGHVVGVSLRRADIAAKRLRRSRPLRPRDAVVVPGFANRLLSVLSRFVPRRMLYFAARHRKKLE